MTSYAPGFLFSIKICLLCSVLILLLFAGGRAETDRIEALWPVPDILPDIREKNEAELDLEPSYIIRQGTVELAVNIFLPRSPEKDKRTVAAAAFQGRNLSIGFFADAEYSLKIDSENRPAQDAILLRGRLPDQDLSTFTMTITPQSYLIRLHDMDNSKLYRVVGDSETGLGRAAEIELDRLPPIRYMPPVIPQEN